MKIQFTCDICNAPMKFIERVESKKDYRIRRFACMICDYKKTVFAAGTIDEVIEPKKSVKEVDQFFKKQADARL